MKHIFLFFYDVTTFGGVERVCVNLANAFDELGYFTTIITETKQYDTPRYPINPNTNLIAVGKNLTKNLFSKNPIKSYWETLKLNKIIKNATLQKANDFAKANNCPPPSIETFIINNVHMRLKIKLKNATYIRIMHGRFMDSFVKDMPKQNEKCLPINRFKKPKITKYDHLIILNTKELPLYKRVHKNIRVIPNFTQFVSESCAKLDSKIVLFAARLEDGQKGVFRLLDIWKILESSTNLNGWELHIAGDGSSKAEMLSKIEQLGLKSVKTFDFARNIDEIYLGASIFVMTSFFESFGMTLIESGSFGLPSIAFDIVAGPSDIIEDGKSGFLVPDGDLQGFADKLSLLMSNDELRKSMGARAKTRSEILFGKQHIMKRWSEII